jgi:hypothetical protein
MQLFLTPNQIPELASLEPAVRKAILNRARAKYWFSRFNLLPSLIAVTVLASICASAVIFPELPLRHYHLDMFLMASAVAYYTNNLLFVIWMRPVLGTIQTEIANQPPSRYEQAGSIRTGDVIEVATVVIWLVLGGALYWLLT